MNTTRWKKSLNNGFEKFGSLKEEYKLTLIILQSIDELYKKGGHKMFHKGGVKNILQVIHDDLIKNNINVSYPLVSYILNKYYFYNNNYTIIKKVEGNTNRNKFLNDNLITIIKDDIKNNTLTIRELCKKNKISTGSLSLLKKYINNGHKFDDEELFKKTYERWFSWQISLIKFSNLISNIKGGTAAILYILKERNLPHQSLYRRIMECSKSKRISLLGYDIKEVYEKQNGRCYFSGKKLNVFFRLSETDGDSVSIDRINSNEDYTKDNIRITSKEFNIFKNCKDTIVFEKECIQVIIQKLKRENEEKFSNTINILTSLLDDSTHHQHDLDKETFDNQMKRYIYIPV